MITAVLFMLNLFQYRKTAVIFHLKYEQNKIT